MERLSRQPDQPQPRRSSTIDTRLPEETSVRAGRGDPLTLLDHLVESEHGGESDYGRSRGNASKEPRSRNTVVERRSTTPLTETPNSQCPNEDEVPVEDGEVTDPRDGVGLADSFFSDLFSDHQGSEYAPTTTLTPGPPVAGDTETGGIREPTMSSQERGDEPGTISRQAPDHDRQRSKYSLRDRVSPPDRLSKLGGKLQ